MSQIASHKKQQEQTLPSNTFKASKKFSQTQPPSSYVGILQDPDLPPQHSVVQYASPQKQRLTLKKRSEQIPNSSKQPRDSRYISKLNISSQYPQDAGSQRIESNVRSSDE